MRYPGLKMPYFIGLLMLNKMVFVDVMDSIIEQLQKTKEYTVTEIGGEGEKVNKITNYRAINSKTHEKDVIDEIASADLVRTPSGICPPGRR